MPKKGQVRLQQLLVIDGHRDLHKRYPIGFDPKPFDVGPLGVRLLLAILDDALGMIIIAALGMKKGELWRIRNRMKPMWL